MMRNFQRDKRLVCYTFAMTSVTPAIEIIQLTAADWPRVKQLRLSALRHDPQAFGSNLEKELAYPDSLWQERHHAVLSGEAWLSCAAADGQLIGMMGAFRSKNNSATIYGVFVEPLYRGQGISKLLLADLLRNIRSAPDIKSIILTVNTEQLAAVRLYQTFGFRTVNEHEAVMGDGDTYKEYQMELALEPEPLKT